MKKVLLTLALASAMSMSAFATNAVTAAAVEGTAGSTVTVELKLASDVAVAGYQATLTPANCLTLTNAAKTTAIDSKDWFGCNLVNSKLNVLFYNENCNTFTSNASKSVFTVPVAIAAGTEAGNYNLVVSNIVLSDAVGNAYKIDDVTIKVVVKPETPTNPVQDINDDGDIDILDILDMLDMYNEDEEDPRLYDFNEDGDIDIIDILDMLDFYGENEELFE